MTLIKYRPEIDGLRTIAVLSVIIYHAEFFFGGVQIFPGGFFGVDMFFVISGFLITSLITKELSLTQKFSFQRFYDKRIRRLLPALIFVMAFSLPFAWFLFLPDALIDYSKSIIASILFVSNFYWFDSLQVYGAEASNLKPFLHTWSLAIEEQYYIFFPIIILIIYKWLRPYIVIVPLTMALISLLYSQSISTSSPLSSFYLLPSRFWEFLIGSLFAYQNHSKPLKINNFYLMKIMPLFGFCLILYSIIFIDFNSFRHPGYITLFPVLGTIIIIAFSNKKEFITKLLSSKLFVSFGLISYSIYLWHFPIFAFFRIGGIFDSVFMKLSSIVCVVLLSIISFKLIERPFRSKVKIQTKKLYSIILTSISLMLFINYLIIKSDGFPERFKGIIASGVNEMKEYRKKYWGQKTAFLNIEDFTENNYSVEIIGNSWAQDIANSLSESSGFEISFRGRTGHRCKAITLNSLAFNDKNYVKTQEKCLINNAIRFKTKLPNTDLVIIADNKWLTRVQDEDIAKEVLKNVKHLRDGGYFGPVMIISNRPTYKKNVFEIIREYGAIGSGINDYSKIYLQDPLELLRKQDEIAYDFYKINNIYYYSLVDSLCSDETCKIVQNNMPLYHDRDHMTMSGIKTFGNDLMDFINKNIKK